MRCKRLRVCTVADVNDLIFVPKCSAVSPSVSNNQATELSVWSHFKRTIQNDAALRRNHNDHRNHWLTTGQKPGRSQVNVIPNGLSKRWGQTSVRHTNSLTDPFRTITYLPGSNSHGKYFSEIVEVLAEALHSHKIIRICVLLEH